MKDLVIDMDRFFEGYKSVKPYLIAEELPAAGSERLQSPIERDRFEDTTKCILCAACTTACPITWTNEEFVGPAAIVNAHRFIFDSRDSGSADRLRILNQRSGVWRCRTIFNCTEVCPRTSKITKAIEEVKRALHLRPCLELRHSAQVLSRVNEIRAVRTARATLVLDLDQQRPSPAGGHFGQPLLVGLSLDGARPERGSGDRSRSCTSPSTGSGSSSASVLYNGAGRSLFPNHVMYRMLKRWSSWALLVFGAGLFFFVVRALQINPFTFAMRFWMWVTVLGLVALPPSSRSTSNGATHRRSRRSRSGRSGRST
jgi:heterodisulfide reductase subunit C